MAIFDIDTEVRFAVVLYGGVSLSIYMNGIAQELLNLVKATAPKSPMSKSPTETLYPDGDHRLLGTAAVYRQVARRMCPSPDDAIRVRFVVDILSGTSAGGINGMFLAKALTRERSLDSLSDLWVEEGDVQRLLNDPKSYEGLPGLVRRATPNSLLNGERMYALLLRALHQMELPEARLVPGADDERVNESRLVDQLDLYMTATDLEGLAMPLYLPSGSAATSDRPEEHGLHRVNEYRHRANFRFRYASPAIEEHGEGEPIHDFVVDNDPFLAFVARCTSSIVPAFETMRLIDTERVLKSRANPNPAKYEYRPADWAYLYRDFWRSAYLYADPRPGRAGGRGGKKTRGANPSDMLDEAQAAFAYRPFGDGGYLDNRPFTYATETLIRRRGDVAVVRKLLYVEPDPARSDAFRPPQALERAATPPSVPYHAQKALSLPSVETIREDIERLRQRNERLVRIRRIQQIAARMDDALDLFDDELTPYYHVRAEDAADRVAETLRRILGLEEDSPYVRALGHVVRAWRDELYPPDDRRQVAAFLRRFDSAYLLRRHDFLQRTLDERLTTDVRKERSDDVRQFRAAKRRLNVRFNRKLTRDVWLPSLRPDLAPPDAVPSAGAPPEAAVDPNAPKSLKTVLDELRIGLGELGYVLGGDNDDPPKTEGALTDEQVRLAQRTRQGRARQVLGLMTIVPRRPGAETPYPGHRDDPNGVEKALTARKGLLRALDDAFARALGLEAVDAELAELLAPSAGEDSLGTEVKAVLTAARDRFARYDSLTFPILYGTGAEETIPVDVVRVSSLEATTLIDDEEARRLKLAGVGMGHFGAFFDAQWRRMDILWGRLDAAERLICTLLPEDDASRGELIAKAQFAILAEANAWIKRSAESTQELNPLIRLVAGRYATAKLRGETRA